MPPTNFESPHFEQPRKEETFIAIQFQDNPDKSLLIAGALGAAMRFAFSSEATSTEIRAAVEWFLARYGDRANWPKPEG